MYQDKEVQGLLAEHKIEYSASVGKFHGNNVVESFNSSFKQAVVELMIKNAYAKQRKSILFDLTTEEKKLNTTSKARNAKVRKKVFKSLYFKDNAYTLIEDVI